MVEAVNTFCGMARAHDRWWLYRQPQPELLLELAWLWFRLWSRFVKNSFVYYFKCQTSMNMPFNNNTFTDKLMGPKQIFLHGKKPEKVGRSVMCRKNLYPCYFHSGSRLALVFSSQTTDHLLRLHIWFGTSSKYFAWFQCSFPNNIFR